MLEQELLLETINEVLSIFNEIGIHNEYMIIAGAGVYCHELNIQGISDRKPNDLDIVLKPKYYRKQSINILHAFHNPPHSVVKGIISTKGCDWCTFLTPGIRLLFKNNFQVDIINRGMSWSFSSDAPMLKEKIFDFPLDQNQVFELSFDIDLPIGCCVRVAHPVFIAVYKLLLQRQKNGKRDLSDVKRLKKLGLLNESTPGFKDMLSLLTKDDMAFQNELLNIFAVL